MDPGSPCERNNFKSKRLPFKRFCEERFGSLVQQLAKVVGVKPIRLGRIRL